MANTIAPEVFREVFSTTLQERTRTNTVAGIITKMRMGEFGATFNNPYRSETVTTSGTSASVDDRLCEIDVQPFTVTNEKVELLDYISSAEEICETNEAYTIVDLDADRMKEMTQAMIEAVDRKVLADASTQAVLATTTPVTDAATAKAAAQEIVAFLSGFAGGMSNRFMVMGNSTYQYFIDLVSQVATPFGDRTLETGDVFTYLGMEVIVVRDSQMPAGVTILSGIKGAIDLYWDQFGVREGRRQLTPTGPNPELKVSLKDARYRLIYLAVKIWFTNLDKVVTSA